MINLVYFSVKHKQNCHNNKHKVDTSGLIEINNQLFGIFIVMIDFYCN